MKNVISNIKLAVMITLFCGLGMVACSIPDEVNQEKLALQKKNFQRLTNETCDKVAESKIKNVLQQKEEVIENLMLIGNAFSVLIQDNDLAQIISHECSKQKVDNDYKVLISNLKELYQKKGKSLNQEIAQANSTAKKTLDLKKLEKIMEAFNVAGVDFQTEINLGFLNRNGDFANGKWDGKTVEFVAVGQLSDKNKMPAWVLNKETQTIDFKYIDMDYAYNHAGWFVQVRTDLFYIITPITYQPYMGPVAKCGCYPCPEGGKICQKTPNPGSECSCKDPGDCSGCIIPL